MSRTRRIFVIASLIVFGLLAPAPSEAVLTHCTGTWQGANDTMVSTCRFKLGGGALAVNGLAVGGFPTTKVEVKLYRYPIELYPTPIVGDVTGPCSTAGPLVAQCSASGNYPVPPTQFDVICVVKGAAALGVFSCRTV
jgi:hypothetical protein